MTDGVKHLLPLFKAELPPSVNMDILYDRSDTIRESFHDITFTMVLTLGLVVMVIFLFLRNVSATIIPSLALPFSIVGTFAVMYLLNYSLDNLSMMALILSIGFVVDDAIVMLENIVRHIEMGERPLAGVAHRLGRNRLHHRFHDAVAGRGVHSRCCSWAACWAGCSRNSPSPSRVAILISGVVSVTLTPMLCSRFLRAAHEESRGWFYRITERFFQGMLHIYDHTLRFVLRHRPATMVSFVVVLAATIYMFITIPKGFIPDQDTDQLQIYTEAAAGHLVLPDGRSSKQQIAETVSQDPNVESLMASVGGTTASNLGGPNYGELVIHLKPRNQRKLGVNDIIKELRPQLAAYPGVKSYLQNPPTIQIGGQVTKSLYQFSLQTPDKKELYAQTDRLAKLVEDIPGVEDVTSDVAVTTPQVNVDDRPRQGGGHERQCQPDRERALRCLRPALGLDDLRLGERIRSAAGTGAEVSGRSARAFAAVFQDAGQQADPAGHAGQGRHRDRAADHQSLRAVAFGHHLLQPEARRGAGRSGGPGARRWPTSELPDTISTQFQGAAKAFQSSLGNLAVLLVIAIMVVYIVLGILYESYIHPITILSGLPSAGFGALLTLELFHMDLSIYAFVGLIMLIGIVKKNAIMQIDFALDAERQHGLPPEKAIYEGCLIRFRPIMMTTMAALLGRACPSRWATARAARRGSRWAWWWWAACSSRSWSRCT